MHRSPFAKLLLASLVLATPPSPGGALGLLREAIALLGSRPLGRERVDWAALERELASTLKSDDPASAAHAAIATAIARLGDRHARFVPAPPPAPPPAEPAQESASPVDRREVPTRPVGRLLDDGIAYLVVPGCAAPDVDGLRGYARAARREIARLAALRPRGWLVELRLNGGGNLWPMLLGLQPLLGDGAAMTTVVGTAIESRYGVGIAAAWIDWGRGPEVQLDWGDETAPASVPTREPVALLLGRWTMSSGEAVALCLAERASARTFGERTAGLTTVTTSIALADGSTLILPLSQMGSLDGRPTNGAIEPSHPVAFGDWPEPDDAAALAARAWLLERSAMAQSAPSAD